MKKLKKIKANVKTYFFHPFIVCIVGTKCKKRENFISIAWFTQLSFQPCIIGISVSPRRFSYELLKKSQGFSINFLDFSKTDIVEWIGTHSGREHNKIKKLKEMGMDIFYTEELNLPALSESYLAAECKKIWEKEFGDHVLFVGEVLNFYIKENFFDENTLPTERIFPVVYAGKGRYLTVDWKKLEKKR